MVLMTVAYLAIRFGVYANVFFLPLIIKDLDFSNLTTSYVAALPVALGAAGMVLVSHAAPTAPGSVCYTPLCGRCSQRWPCW